MRSSFDLSPFRRSTVGFDRLFDMIERSLPDITDTWPPFNLEKEGEDGYRITLAVAGFRPDEIEVVVRQNQLIVTGRKEEQAGDVFGRAAQRPQMLLAQAMAEADRLLGGAAIQARCIECAAHAEPPRPAPTSGLTAWLLRLVGA